MIRPIEGVDKKNAAPNSNIATRWCQKSRTRSVLVLCCNKTQVKSILVKKNDQDRFVDQGGKAVRILLLHSHLVLDLEWMGARSID